MNLSVPGPTPSHSGQAWLFATALAIAAAAGPARAEDFAILIAARDYESGGKSGLRNLKYSRNDIVDLGAMLVECGYRKRNIVMMHDGHPDPKFLPECEKINDQLDLLFEGLTPQDTILVALAGHGVQFARNKVNYFCPLDANLEERKNLLSLADVYDRLREAPASRKLLLVDACRDDPISSQARSSFPRMDLASETRPQVEDVPEQTFAIFSCSTGQRSWEDDKLKHGIFFAHVLKGLEGAADQPEPDGRVTIQELASFVERETLAYARVRLNQVQMPTTRTDGRNDWVLRTLPSAPVARGGPKAEARRLLASGDFARARSAFDRAVKQSAGDARAFLGRGLAAAALGDLATADADFREAIRLDPADAQAWTSLGGSLGRAGRFVESVEAYSEALRLAPGEADALAGRGAAQIQLGRLDLGFADLEQALRARPDHVDALYNRAFAHQKRGDQAAARSDLERARAIEAGR